MAFLRVAALSSLQLMRSWVLCWGFCVSPQPGPQVGPPGAWAELWKHYTWGYNVERKTAWHGGLQKQPVRTALFYLRSEAVTWGSVLCAVLMRTERGHGFSSVSTPLHAGIMTAHSWCSALLPQPPHQEGSMAWSPLMLPSCMLWSN